MLKHIKKNIRKIHSIFTISLLLFQNIAPLSILATPAYAAETPVVSDVSLDFASEEHQLTLKGSVNTDTQYLLTYDDNDEETPQEAITGSVNGANFEENIFVGTCSSEECVEDEFNHGSLEFTEANYKADYHLTDGVLWLTKDNVSSVAQVELNKTYVAPQNDQVSVTFTSLPENAGNLNIEEIILSDEQVESLGALSNVAYDITSSMEDGTFEYDLTLPLPEGADGTAKVVYAENLDGLSTGEELTNTITGNEIKAVGVDHFTVFVVTINPGADCVSGVYAVGVCYSSLQDAVDGSSNGDTIDILSDITIGHRVDVNKEITIDGHSNTISPTFTKTNNSNNSSLVIFSDNTTVKNLIIDGTNGTNLHGIQAYVADNVLFDNLTVLNNDASGITVNGSTVTVNNVTTSGNGWGGINVDQGGGVTTEAKLIVTGSSSHDESTHIWLDDITKTVSVDDTVGQYSYTDYGNTRVYTFKDTTNPVLTNIKMFVNGVESTFMRAGDLVRVEADITDTGSGMGSVRLLAKNASGGGYIDSGYFVNTTGYKFVREFTFPADGKYIDLHTPITTVVDGLRFYIKAFDQAGNYTNSPATTFTYDKGIPSMSDIKMYVSEDGSSYTEKSFVKPGDFVRIEVVADDAESGIRDVEFRITSKSNAYVAPREWIATPVSGNIYRFEYQVPADGKYINTHGLMSEVLNDHTFWARATDNVGNYNHGIKGDFTYDNTNPTMPTGLRRLGGDGNEYQCSDFSLRQNMVPKWDDSIEDDFSHYEYSSFHPSGAQGLNEKVLYQASLPNTWVAPVDGTYGFAVRAVDQAGNKSDWALSEESLGGSCQINYDSEAPTTPEVLGFLNPDLDCGSITNIHNTTVDWTDSTDSGSGFSSYEYFIDYPKPNGTRGQWTTTRTTSQYGGSLNEGTHNVKVRAMDVLGNYSDWSNTCSITTDWTAPVTTLTSPTDNTETNQSILIEGSSTDTNGVDEVNLYYSEAGQNNWQLITTLSNGSNDEPFNFSYDWTPSVEGTYDIKVAGTDVAGNVESSAYAYGVVYDVTSPSIPTWGTIYKGHGTSAANEIGCEGYTNDTKVTFEWNANSDSDLKGYWFGTKFKEKHQWFDAGSTIKTANMTAGNNPYHYTLIAVDNAGNESNLSDQCGLTLDQEAPNVEITNPTTGLVTGTIDIRGTVEDDNPHHYWFVIQNSSGTTVAGPGVVNDTNSFTDKLLLSWDTTLVADGTYTIKLEARDSANNKDGGSAHWIEVSVDHIDPSSIISSFGLEDGGEVQTSTFSGLIEGSATDDFSGVDHVLLSISHLGFGEEESSRTYWDATGSAWVATDSLFRANGTTSWDYQLSDVPEGFYTVTSHAIDVAGNVEDTYTIKIVFDKTIPEVLLAIDPTTPGGERGWYRYNNPTITLTASDNYSLERIEYQWNSTTETWTTYSSPINPPGEGQNILYYRSIDTIGNISSLGIKEVKYDATNPAGEPLEVKVEKITSDTADASWKAPSDDSDVTHYKVSWKHEDGTSYGVDTGRDDFFHQLDNLYDGVWTVSVKAVDDAGNFTEKKLDFRVGPGPAPENDEGTVLGVTTGTGVGGVYTAGTTTIVDADGGKKDDSTTKEETVVLSEDGEVLGDTTCSPWASYLPLILLVLQLAVIIGLEIMKKDSGSFRFVALVGITLVTIGLFYFMKNSECYTQETFINTVAQWFALLSIGVGISAKMIAHMFIEE
ncbi:MAG: Ig-like domain-containing protein [Candidatus Pacebacteria bacterium]|nr:Ig-like domain-containing protein [Candidatus Paceibacterota bacterium]